LIDEQIFEKYKAKEVAYLKIDENILGNLSEILQNLTKPRNKKICF
jgi:primosomal protein N' (replication factor Y)